VSIKQRVEKQIERGLDTYPGEVVRRFFELQIIDKSLGLSAQAFIALLPMLIVVISVVLKSNGEVVGEFIIDRFALAGVSKQAVTALFATSTAVAAVSWLAIVVTVLSALSLARRLSGVFASIFDVPKLPGRRIWRALLWILVQMVMITGPPSFVICGVATESCSPCWPECCCSSCGDSGTRWDSACSCPRYRAHSSSPWACSAE
jgi:hypothetical protein